MTLFTIGYEKRTIAEYIELLTGNNVSIVIDVRDNPWSHKPDFRKENLKQHLQNTGIEYIHVPEAGSPKYIRTSGSKPRDAVLSYKKYLHETKSGLNEISTIIRQAAEQGKTACLTCLEKNYLDCHRSVIADTLKESTPSLEIHHI